MTAGTNDRGADMQSADRRPFRAPWRTGAALLLSGASAPVMLFMLIGIWTFFEALGSGDVGTPGRISDLFGPIFTLLVLVSPLTATFAIVAGWPCVVCARHLGLTSVIAHIAGGAALSLLMVLILGSRDLAAAPKQIVMWGPTALLAIVTGSLCGALYWAVAERPRRTPA